MVLDGTCSTMESRTAAGEGSALSAPGTGINSVGTGESGNGGDVDLC